MIKIKAKYNVLDDTFDIKVKANESNPLEFFGIIKRCFEIVAKETKTDIKQVKKYYREYEKINCSNEE